MQETQNENIFDFLNKLGYSKSAAKKRVQIYANAEKGIGLYENNKIGGDYDIVIAGSRGDGTGVYRDCDIDKLLVQNRVKCFEKGHQIMNFDQNSTIFELDTEDTPNGYAKLRLITKADDCLEKLHINVLDALECKDGQQYLKNDCILGSSVGQNYSGHKDGWMVQTMVQSKTCTGPSKSSKFRTPFFGTYISLDDVLAFKVISSDAAMIWCIRERRKGWPSKDLIELVKGLEVFVVPVGLKGSDEEHLQWRISLTKGELILVQSFNDVQMKVCENFTSYIMKNILFWQMEQTDPEDWQASNFNERLAYCLLYLKNCIENEVLSNYMIATRNMLKGKISASVKGTLIQKVEELINGHFPSIIKYIIVTDILGFDVKDSPHMTIVKPEAESMSKSKMNYLTKGESCCNKEPNLFQGKEYNGPKDQGWSVPDTESISRCIRKRIVREQFALSTFTLPSKDCEDVLSLLFEANEQSEIINIISKKVFPYIRIENPFCFFDDIKSLKDEEIFALCEGESVSSKHGCVLL